MCILTRSHLLQRPGRGAIRGSTLAVLTACVTACVGPKYVRPDVATPAAYKETASNAYTDSLTQTWRPAQPQDALLKGKWWEVFNEPELNALEEQLNVNNQTLAQSFQNFLAARAQVNEARASYFP